MSTQEKESNGFDSMKKKKKGEKKELTEGTEREREKIKRRRRRWVGSWEERDETQE